MLAASPAEALALFERNKKDDRLVQDKHHKEVAGRHFSDILGVLGDELQSPSDCPERIMPLWLAHTASRLFRAQPLDRAKEWGLQFYAELKRLDGKLPFRHSRLARQCRRAICHQVQQTARTKSLAIC